MAELVSQKTGDFSKYGERYMYQCVYCCNSQGLQTIVLSNTPCSSSYGTLAPTGQIPNQFGGGKFSGGMQGQISRGFGSTRGSDMVMGLGGSQIARAKVGRSVNFNPIYNKPQYVVSANMRELRRRKAQSQRPALKLGARRF
mgnify:CR=1 FL=1|tara:strand:- start:7248 stop:7673 length:426 start_codon:yes stop_codon:yes gene_type:complete